VVGSLSGVARGQLRSLSEGYGCRAVPVAGEPGALEEVLGLAREGLVEGGSVAVHSAEERNPLGAAGSVVEALAEVAAGLSEEGLIDALVLTGGETAVGVGRRLGAVGVRLEGEVEPGIPVGTLIGPSPYRVVTKAGAFGGPDTLVRVVEKLRGKD